MGWTRNKSAIAPQPEEPSLILWLMPGVVALMIGVLLFVLHASKMLGDLQAFDPWIIAASPLVFWFLAFCLRGWFYNNAFNQHQFESDEADYAQQQWVEWAGRHLAVLHCDVILPDPLTVARFIQAPADMEQHRQQARRISEGEVDGLTQLLKEARDALQRLPADLPLNLILLTDSTLDISSLHSRMSETWRRVMPEGFPLPDLQIQRQQSLLALEARLKLPEISAELILIEQLNGGDSYSDALAALLLTTDDVTTKYRFKHSARLLRPMQVNREQQHEELALYFGTQTQANSTQLIIGDDDQRSCSFSEVLSASDKTGSRWAPGQVHWLEKYAGISGPFSPWVMAAVTSSVVELYQLDCMMLSNDGQQRFITTVTKGKQDE